MSDIKIGRMVLGSVSTNTYFIYREESPETIVVDPADYGELIHDKLAQNGRKVVAILLTHGHFDHIWGVEALKKAAGADSVSVYASEAEKSLLGDTRKNVSAQAGRPCAITADHYLKDGEECTIAGMTFRTIATPGHTEGGCCFYFPEGEILVSGDTLFQDSVGRTDLPTGNMGTLVRSIREKLFVLPEEVKVYPGHGEVTTIGHEKQYNPFCV